VGVQHATQPLGGFVDVAVARVALSALEDEVLEEVRHPVLRRELAARAGVERDQNRQGSGTRQRDPVNGQAVGCDHGRLYACHRRYTISAAARSIRRALLAAGWKSA